MAKQHRKLRLLPIATIFWAANSFAQAPDTLWTRTYGGVLDDSGISVRQTADGGYIIAGHTDSFGGDDIDVYLVRTDANGDTLWTRTYGGAHEDYGNSVEETSDGGYVIGGYTSSFAPTPVRPDLYLIKTDTYGDTIWTRTYGGTWSDQGGHAVQETPDGGYVIAGCTEVEFWGDAYLVRTDKDGNLIWEKTYGGTYTDWINAVQVTSDSGFILAGFTGYIPNWDAYLLRTDKDGNALWTRVYGGPHDDVAWSIQQVPDGGYIAVGRTESFSVGGSDVWLLRTDANGDTLWTKTYGGIDEDKGYSIQLKDDGGYIMAGSSVSFSAGEEDVYLLRTDASGDTLWTKTYGGVETDVGYSIQQTSDGGYIIAGFTCSFGIAGPDVYLIKTEPDLGIKENRIRDSRILIPRLKVSPNPFREKTEIRFEISEPGAYGPERRSTEAEISLDIYDVAGRLVRDFSLPGTGSPLPLAVSWNGRNNAGGSISSGAYLLKFKAGRHEMSRKLLMLK